MVSGMQNNKERAYQILEKMSLRDKIGQVTQLSFNANDIELSCKTVREIRPGSLILCWSALGGKEEQQKVCVEALNKLQKTAVEDTPCKIPLLFGRDVIHGHHVAFPVPLTMTQSFDFDLIEQSFDAIRQEAITDGIKWTFAPMLDMSHEPRWGRIVEGTGEDPYLGSLFAKACVRGFQTDNHNSSDSMLACAKHFVGYGASEGGRDYNHTEISDYNLQNNYLPAFRSAIEEGVATVMSAFNDINGIPVTANEKILTFVLRDELGFKGFVVSDWAAIEQLHLFCGFSEDRYTSAKLSLKAGVDMDMYCNCYLDNIEELVNNGDISVDELDRAVLRIIETKLNFGLFEHPYVENKTYDRQAHLGLAQKLAEESIVLLKNNNGILPLKKDAVINYCGNFADEGAEMVGTWSLDYDRSLISTVREEILSVGSSVKLIDVNEDNVIRSTLVKKSECTLIVIGEKREVTGEAASLADISIPKSQIDLLKAVRETGKPVIGVLCFARPITLGKDDDLFDAILWCGHGGTRASKAIANVLFGDAEPQGRLPFTLPYSVGQLPLYYNALPGSRKINGYYNDLNPVHGNYYDCTGSPNYPFGYGLSYTSFEFGNISCSHLEIPLEDIKNGKTIGIDFTVKNTGERSGVCIPQLYVRDLVASRVRPLRSLVQICRILLNPGEDKVLHFDIGTKSLCFHDESGKSIIEGGCFEFYIGESCLTENKITVKLLS